LNIEILNRSICIRAGVFLIKSPNSDFLKGLCFILLKTLLIHFLVENRRKYFHSLLLIQRLNPNLNYAYYRTQLTLPPRTLCVVTHYPRADRLTIVIIHNDPRSTSTCLWIHLLSINIFFNFFFYS